MSHSLRFIIDPPRSAFFNMAADLFLMQQCSASPVITVRFYSWKPPAITLGRLQRSYEQLVEEHLQRDGITWIRRPTGGRAVLHREDLTYSCIFSRSIAAMGSGVADTYAIITRCLVEGLAECGIALSAQERSSPLIKSGRSVKLPCFLAPNRNEIMVNGRKLIGSAQYRSSDSVLQHGSLPLTDAYRRLPYYMPLSDDERLRQQEQLKQKSIALAEINPRLSGHEIIEALIQGFRGILSCPHYRSDWNSEELDAIGHLASSDIFQRQWLQDYPSGAAPE
ncbi:MAG: lipoate--protein ligase family protein [Chitinispirillaceae bacterium]|nr:lipoate--protein ligase family protein [Chitinispirillaceae bacterium]